MALSKKTAIGRPLLERLADERLRDFDVLRNGGRFAAAIYLGVYALECLLKAHICKTLDLPELPVIFKSHSLEPLLFHSGLYQRIQAAPQVYGNFKSLDSLWNPEDDTKSIRYVDVTHFVETDADNVRAWMSDPQHGVFTWLRSQL